MRYFKAIEILEKPFIDFALWANSLTELEARGQEKDPLIIQEIDLPDTVFGVCPLKIVSGELVARTAPEIEAARIAYNLRIANIDYQSKLNDVNAGTFVYDSQTFPMHELARVYYSTIDKLRGDSYPMQSNGVVYILTDASTNIDDFLDAYYAALQLLSQPKYIRHVKHRTKSR